MDPVYILWFDMRYPVLLTYALPTYYQCRQKKYLDFAKIAFC